MQRGSSFKQELSICSAHHFCSIHCYEITGVGLGTHKYSLLVVSITSLLPLTFPSLPHPLVPFFPSSPPLLGTPKCILTPGPKRRRACWGHRRQQPVQGPGRHWTWWPHSICLPDCQWNGELAPVHTATHSISISLFSLWLPDILKVCFKTMGITCVHTYCEMSLFRVCCWLMSTVNRMC